MRQEGLVLLMSFVVALSAVAGAQAQGAQIQNGTGDRASGSTSQSLTTEGGNVTNVNVSSTSITSKWAGFYGQISGSEILADSGDNNFFKWKVSDPTGSIVYSVPTGQGAPSGLDDVKAPNGFLGSEFDSGADSAANTYNETDFLNSSVYTEVNTSAASTFVSGSYEGPGGTFQTFLANDTGTAGNASVYAAEAQSDNTGFNTQDVDYQMLVGIGESTAQSTFDFYIELS